MPVHTQEDVHMKEDREEVIDKTESISLLVHRALGVSRNAQYPELAVCSTAVALFLTKIACQRSAGELERSQVRKTRKVNEGAKDEKKPISTALSDEGDMIVSGWKAAFEAYLTKAGCRFPQNFLSDTLRAQPWLALALGESLLGYCVHSRNAFLRSEVQQVFRRPYSHMHH